MAEGYRNNQFGTDLLAQYSSFTAMYRQMLTAYLQQVEFLNPQTLAKVLYQALLTYITLNPKISDNRRSVAPINVPPPPSRQIGTNEMLMRVGGKIMGGAAKGGLNAMDAGIRRIRQIKDYNRSSSWKITILLS